MTRDEIIAWCDESMRRAAEPESGAPLTPAQLVRVVELKRKAAALSPGTEKQ